LSSPASTLLDRKAQDQAKKPKMSISTVRGVRPPDLYVCPR